MDVPMDTSGSGAPASSSRRLGNDVCHVHTSGFHRKVRPPESGRDKRPRVEAVVSERVTLADIEASADAVMAEDDCVVKMA